VIFIAPYLTLTIRASAESVLPG